MFKFIAWGQCTLDVEFKGRKVRFRGDGTSGKPFMAWANFTEWLPHDPDAPMTVEEKMEIMRIALQCYGDNDFQIEFFDDRIGNRYRDSILIDSHGEPYAYIDGDYIKSSKANPNCFCEVFDEMDELSEIVYRKLKFAIRGNIGYKPVDKVHVWKRYGKYKEEWYKCRKCGQVWRLVYPQDSFKGLWKRVK